MLLALLFVPVAHALLCTSTITPGVTLEPATARVATGTTLNGSFTLYRAPNGTVTGYTFITPREGLNFSLAENGSFAYRPSRAAVPRSTILFYAVSSVGCAVTRVATFDTLYPPVISNETPALENVSVDEGVGQRFNADSETGVSSAWLFDGAVVKEGVEPFWYSPDFNSAGSHTISYLVEDAEGLTSRRSWNVVVENVNRAPLQLTRFIGVLLPIGGSLTLNMSYYFFDPDRTPLSFNVSHKPLLREADDANVSVEIKGEMVTITGRKHGKAILEYHATDPLGARATSESVTYTVDDVRVAERQEYCGDRVCTLPENCTSCIVDCGECAIEPCIPEYTCSDWGSCAFPGYEYRTCVVSNGCTNTNATSKPPEARECNIEPSCADGVHNGLEEGVDCGGPCPPCPTCSDGVLNQGEEEVDCGGPCPPCPTCSDGLQNQGETSVDCGGPCNACPPGASCAAFTDCQSKICEGGRCATPSCTDGIVNQDEEGIDCGGTCPVCPTCDDGVQNGREEGVDCGGKCAPCPSCTDGLLNQDEEYVDCGGSCRECSWNDYAPLILWWVQRVGMLLGLLFGIIFLRLFFASRFLFLARHGKTIHFFYEDGFAFWLVRHWNAWAKLWRRGHGDERKLISTTYQELSAMRGRIPEETLRAAVAGKLRALYASLLGSHPGFELAALVVLVKKSRYPFTLKVILLSNTKLLAQLEGTRLFADGTLALEAALSGLKELHDSF